MNEAALAGEAAGRARSWLIEKAFPLWSARGFDAQNGRFHERLAFDGSPLPQPGYRLMVQARQIATFAQASLLGWFDGACLAERAYATMVESYYRADDREGWVFSIDGLGRPRDVTRDLYGHAFVLYALAWMHRLTGSGGPTALAHDTLDWIETGMAGIGSGFRDAVPERDALRRQNPHMHLFEAVLALWEVTGDDRFAAWAGALADLFAGHLLGTRGVVLELFDVEWCPVEVGGRNIVEPGHQFEWVWLLRWYQRLSGLSVDGHIQTLLDHALGHGVRGGTGIVIDTLDETGIAVTRSRRSWTHAEALKAVAVEHERGRPFMASHATAFLGEIATTFAPKSLEGGWIDHVDRNGAAIVDFMPASTLYHFMGAIAEANRVFR